MREDVWRAFEDLEMALTAWRDSSQGLPSPLKSEARAKAKHALDQCNRRIKERFPGNVYLPTEGEII
jgi:hypothetical protein